jgi:integrase
LGCDNKEPSSYFLDFYRSGRQQIFCDERGILLDTKARAELLAEQIKYEIDKGTFTPEKYRKAELKRYWTDALLDQFWEVKKKKIAPSALNNYKRMIKAAKQFFGTRDVRDIRKIHLIEYHNHLVNIPVGSKTIWNYLSLFKTFLNWCKNDLGILSLVPPFPSVEQQEEPKINWVSAGDQIKLLSHARVEDKPLLMFLMLSGTRPCEARALKVSDVDLAKKLIYVRASFSGKVYRRQRKGKGAKGYAIPIHTEILPYIQQRLKSALPGAWLFPSPRHGGPFSYQRLAKAWKLIRRRAGITYRLRLYDATRHSFASNLLAKGESLFSVATLMGHQDMKTTMIYAHPDLESLRRSISKISLLKESEPEQVAKEKG